MATSRTGYLLIADITGYTSYLSHSELEHAQGVLTTLLELLIEHTRPPLAISRLAGDAVISYALEGTPLHGQTFVDGIERTYVAFRRAIERMVLNNSCQCNACANVNALDLKCFVHHGTFGVQRLGEHDELVGNDVNLIHRLLKNRVTERTGIVAYTLYTEAAVDRLGLAGFGAGLVPHLEEYEHLGVVKARIQDMRPIWERRRFTETLSLPADRVLASAETELAMPREVAWDYLTHPEFRKVLLAADRVEVEDAEAGRVAAGSTYQCFHGGKRIPLTILEWLPPERLLTEVLLPIPIPHTYQLVEFTLESAPSGTRLVQRIGKARGPLLGRVLADFHMRRSMKKQGRRDLETFRDRIQDDLAEATPLPEVASVSADRIARAAASSLAGPRPAAS